MHIGYFRKGAKICVFIIYCVVVGVVFEVSADHDELILEEDENHSLTSCCDHYLLSYLCRECYGNCVLRKNPAESLRQILKEKFFGQKHLVREMVNMLELHQLSNVLTSFHIAGDNGCGKTYAVKLIAEALFQYDPGYSLLRLVGSTYQGSDPETVKRHRNVLFNQITTQLKKCSHSLILIDEVEYIHSSTLLVLQQFFDNSVDYVLQSDGTKVFKNRVLIGLISDFGSEGRTQNMTFDDLQQLIYEHTLQLWSIDPRQTHLIQFTFPFTSLSDKDIENIIAYKVRHELPNNQFRHKVKKITVTDQALSLITKLVRKKFPLENGRGAEKWVLTTLVPKISEQIRGKIPPVTLKIDAGDELQFTVTGFKEEL